VQTFLQKFIIYSATTYISILSSHPRQSLPRGLVCWGSHNQRRPPYVLKVSKYS